MAGDDSMVVSKASAIASTVTSSCVGPTPPEVNTKSYRADSSRTSETITSCTSGTVFARARVIPRDLSVRASSARF